MNRIPLIIGCLVFGFLTQQVLAQETLKPISSFQASYELTINTNGEVAEIKMSPTDSFPFEVKKIALVHGDLNIQFHLKKGSTGLEIEFEIQNFRLQASAKTTDSTDQVPALNLNSGQKWLIGDLAIRKADPDALHSITWMNVQEQLHFPLKGVFKLEIQGVGKGELPIDCNKSYEFDMGKRLSHVGLATVGAGFIIWGLAQNTKADNLYHNQYLERTVNDDETKRLLELSNSRRHEYLIMTYGGLVILGADLLWYVLREKKLKNYRALKEKYCGFGVPGFLVRPKVEFGPGAGTAQLGLSLNINLNK